MQFSISQIIRASQLQFGLLSAETSAFLLLSMCEDSALGAYHPDPSRLFLEPGGAVSSARLEAATPAQVDCQLRQVLGALLAVSVGGNPRLTEVVDGQTDGLPAFRSELSRALIPINRAAAQRALTRLHRRVAEVLAHAPGTPPAPTVEVAPPATVSAHRSPRRRPPLPLAAVALEVGLVSDIEVETAGFEVLAPTALELGTAFPEIVESVTPFLGSLELEAYEPAPLGNFELDEDALGLTDPVARAAWQTDGAGSRAEACTAAEAGETEFAQSALPTGMDQAFCEEESADAESLTVRFWSLPPTAEREPAAPEYAGGAAFSPYIGDFLPASSEVNDLLRDFAPEVVAPRHVLARRLRRFTDAESAGEQSRTPPPVQAESHENEPVVAAAKRPPLLAWMASAAVVVGALCLRFSPHVPASERASASLPVASCVAQVQVETERDAVVQLISDAGRVSQPGPHAVFDHVLCATETRVVVQLPDTAKSTQTAEWLQVPVPEPRLRLAAGSGEPIVLRVFPTAH